MAQKIRIFVISAVVPDAFGFGGELVLHRYLNLDPDVETKIYKWTTYPFRLRIIGKLKGLGLDRVSSIIECLWPVYPKAKELDEIIKSFKPDLIITVAHAWLHVAAVKASQRNRIPLITFFQDWWADSDSSSGYCNKRIDQIMRRTCQLSRQVIGVSEGMLQELGNPSHGRLIHDLPSILTAGQSTQSLGRSEGPLRLIYFGNLAEYGPMIESLLVLCEDRQDIELHVFGPKPNWSNGAEEHFRKVGLFHGFLPRDEFVSRVAEFDGILATMEFDKGLQRRMMTSFPSKLIEGVQFGLPIIVWGPEYCSAVKWARMKNRALCVTDPSAEALITAISEHKDKNGDIDLSEYSLGSRLAAEEEFNPLKIRKQFREVLDDALGEASDEIAAENNCN